MVNHEGTRSLQRTLKPWGLNLKFIMLNGIELNSWKDFCQVALRI